MANYETIACFQQVEVDLKYDQSEMIDFLLRKANLALDEVMHTLIFTGFHMMDRDLFLRKIGESMYTLIKNDLVYEPEPGRAINAIREDMEYRFRKGHDCDHELVFRGEAVADHKRNDAFMGLLASTIAGWCATELMDIDLYWRYIANQSIDAAWTASNEELMKLEWQRMSPVMEKYHGKVSIFGKVR